MPRSRRQPKPLDTIGEVSDDLWSRIEPILDEDWHPSPLGGRPPADRRRILNAVTYRLRSGCQWNRLPKEFGDDATIHRWFQRWSRNGVMQRIWSALVADCGELGGVDWQWQSADGVLGKARFGGEKVGKNPTDRGKTGSKRSLLVEAQGGPLAIVVAPANVNDHLLLPETIAAIVVNRPTPTAEQPQPLCLDAGYDNPKGRSAATQAGYTPPIRPIKKEGAGKRKRGQRPRRGVVERTIAWLNKCRAIVIRYDKQLSNYLGLLQLACGLLWYRRLHRLLLTSGSEIVS
jgi:putative transposase